MFRKRYLKHQGEKSGNERYCHVALKTLKRAGVCLQSDNRPKKNLRGNIRNFPTNKKGNSLKLIQPRKLLKIVRLEEAIEGKRCKVTVMTQWEKESFVFNYFNQRVIPVFSYFLYHLCSDKMLTVGF